MKNAFYCTFLVLMTFKSLVQAQSNVIFLEQPTLSQGCPAEANLFNIPGEKNVFIQLGDFESSSSQESGINEDIKTCIILLPYRIATGNQLIVNVHPSKVYAAVSKGGVAEVQLDYTIRSSVLEQVQLKKIIKPSKGDLYSVLANGLSGGASLKSGCGSSGVLKVQVKLKTKAPRLAKGVSFISLVSLGNNLEGINTGVLELNYKRCSE